MYLDIVTPERRLTHLEGIPGEVSAALIPGQEGYFQVGDGHEPFLTMLGTGTLTFFPKGKSSTGFSVIVSGGYCEVDGQNVTVMTTGAAAVEEIDLDSEKKRHAELTKEFAQMSDRPVDDPELQTLKRSLDESASKLKLMAS